MDPVPIRIGYDYQVLARHKRKREAQWTIVSESFDVLVPAVPGSAAPRAGALRLAGIPTEERYRLRDDGRLYREVPGLVGRDGALAPATAAACRAHPTPLRIGTLGQLPWKWQEKGAEFLYGEIAEVMEDRRADSVVRLADRAAELLFVDGVLHVPSDPPMLSVSHLGRFEGVVSGAEMEKEDPEYDRLSRHLSCLFSLARRDEAIAFAGTVRARLLRDGVLRGDDEFGPHPGWTMEIAPGMEAAFACDDITACARRCLSYRCHDFVAVAATLDAAALRALAEMRETVLAMERPEGRTRANARRAFAAMRRLAEAEDGGWTGRTASREARSEIARLCAHLVDRCRTDRSFAAAPEEGLSSAEEAAMLNL